MKLIKFGVNNFRAIYGGLENNQINFQGSNSIFIFGQNNVGKSTFLSAYDFFYKNEDPKLDDWYRRDPANEMEFELELGVDANDLEYISNNQATKVSSFKKFLSDNSTIRIKRTWTFSAEGAKIKVVKKDFTLNPLTGDYDKSAFGSIGLIQVFQALMPTPIFINAMPTEQEVEKVVNDILSSKAQARLSDKEFTELKEAQAKVQDLQDKMYNPASIDEYQEKVNLHFQQLFPDRMINISETDKVKWTEDKFGKKFSVEFIKKNLDGTEDNSTPSSYNTIGHGAVRSAIFSLLLMRDVAEEMKRTSGRKEYLILFEEPELFLYPKLLKGLRELVYAVSEEDFPYQILCASHSPQMIDVSKRNSTLIRMVRIENGTKLYQVRDEDLLEANGSKTVDDLKHAMYEVLRFNPHICESFYADEVLLVEGPTEEILIRGILQRLLPSKDLFIVNCGTVNNIPFYQKVYRKFAIKSHVICDTDCQEIQSLDNFSNPVFEKGIQSAIYNEHLENCKSDPKIGGLLRVHNTTFEVAHLMNDVHIDLRYPNNLNESHGKPYNANRYWLDILAPNFESEHINSVPIIAYLKEILSFKWN